jgi:predicted small lipoprotein YifL
MTGKIRRSIVPALALLLLALALPLAACGKKAQPEPPPGVPDTFPRTYPSQ